MLEKESFYSEMFRYFYDYHILQSDWRDELPSTVCASFEGADTSKIQYNILTICSFGLLNYNYKDYINYPITIASHKQPE